MPILRSRASHVWMAVGLHMAVGLRVGVVKFEGRTYSKPYLLALSALVPQTYPNGILVSISNILLQIGAVPPMWRVKPGTT